MKKNITHIASLLRRYACLAALPLLAACQLHEEPMLTADGELGVDPTQVTVNAELSLSLPISERTAQTTAQAATRAEGETTSYMHRIIVEAYLDNVATQRQVVYEEEIEGRTHLTVPVSLKLHARNYRIAVWADYVQADTQEDWFYDTTTLTPVIDNGNYQGNNERKDAFYGVQSVDLTGYRDEWNAVVSTDMTLTRPVARYELVATDMEQLRQKVTDGEAADGAFTVRVKYSDYLDCGFDLLEEAACNPLMYMQYTTTLNIPDETTDYYTIGFDYVFCDAAGTDISIEVEVVDSQSVTVARSIISVPCTQGMNTTVRDNFLTADPALAEDGVGIDSGYDDESDLVVDII